MEDTEQKVEGAPRVRALAISSEENSWKRHALYGGAPHKGKDRIAHRSLAKHLTRAASIPISDPG